MRDDGINLNCDIYCTKTILNLKTLVFFYKI